MIRIWLNASLIDLSRTVESKDSVRFLELLAQAPNLTPASTLAISPKTQRKIAGAGKI